MKSLMIKNFILISFIVLIFSGCAVFEPTWKFTKQRYINTITYFNTYYNAHRLFTEAEDEVLKNERAALEKPSKNLTGSQSISATARQKFTQSIEKNSKILSFYSDSKWVDAALLMIGKAYYYQEDDVKAERKFLELFAKFPQSDLISESKLWYGKSLLREKKISEAIQTLEDLYKSSRENGDDERAGNSALTLGKYQYDQKNYALALRYFSLTQNLLDDDIVNAQTQYLIGDCYLNIDSLDKAIEAYNKVNDFSPIYFQLFQSKIQIVKIFVKQKNHSIALEQLNNLLSDAKNKEYNSIIHFEIGNTLLDMDNVGGAITKYRYVDTTFVRTDEAARSYFILATLYEKRYSLYDSARMNYEKAKNEFPQSEINPEATRKTDIFNKYFVLRKEFSVIDSLNTKTMNDTIRIDTLSIARLYIPPKKDTTVTKIKKGNTKKEETVFPDSVAFVDSVLGSAYKKKLENQHVMADSFQRTIAKIKFELAGLFYLELQVPDSSLYWYNEVFQKHKTSEFASRALYTIADLYNTQQKSKSMIDSVYKKLIDQYPKTVYAQEARKILGVPLLEESKDSAMYIFLTAESLSTINVSKAIELYKKIASQYSSSTFSPKALYAAGWHYENSLTQNDSAVAVYYRLVATYPTTQFAVTVRGKILEYEAEKKRIEEETKQKVQKEKEEKEEKERLEKEKFEKEKQTTVPGKISLPTNGLLNDSTQTKPDSLKTTNKN